MTQAPPARAASAEPCLASMLCSLKRRQLRRGSPPWSPDFCRLLAGGVLASAQRHALSPALIVAVMMNESDLDERAALVSRPRGVLAKDSGLMGIRCLLDGRGRCTNGLVRGLAWRQVMDPLTNVELGARYLAHYRDGAASSCRHRKHAYWAHYNHGTRYITRGEARHYPHHVAVLYYALARSLGLATADLASAHLTIHDPGMRVRTADRPVGERYVKLCDQIRAVDATCGEPARLVAGVATAPAPI